MTKAEVFKELLKKYEEEATALIWESSCDISRSEKMLEKEIAEWAKRYEEEK